MRGEKGITLITLITYIIVLLLAISAVTVITNFLMNNMNEMQDSSSDTLEINKFDYAFLNDIKRDDVWVEKISEDGKRITLLYSNQTDVQYFYDEESKDLYRIETSFDTQSKRKINTNKLKDFAISDSSIPEEGHIYLTINGKTKEYQLGKY